MLGCGSGEDDGGGGGQRGFIGKRQKMWPPSSRGDPLSIDEE